jgi:uncharacterized protein (UPF0248 family)
MQTIIELVNEIRWNPNLTPGEYTLGYYDRVAKEIKWIRFLDIDFDQTDKFSLVVLDESGYPKHIPFHRFRQVKKVNETIWKREKED